MPDAASDRVEREVDPSTSPRGTDPHHGTDSARPRVEDPFALVLGAGRGPERDAAESNAFTHEEPTVEGLALRGTAILARYAERSIGRELRPNDNELDTVASDLISNLLHAIAARYDEETAFSTCGAALANLISERAEYAARSGEEPALDNEVDERRLDENLQELAESAKRRCGIEPS